MRIQAITGVIFILMQIAWQSIGMASDKQPFTIKALYDLKSVSDISLSPDGSKLLYVVGESRLNKGETFSNIYCYDIKKNSHLQLTHANDESNSKPFWSADSQYIYFLSSRKKNMQLWKMNAAGGEAFRVTKFHSSINGALLNAKTNTIIFKSTVFPECMTDGKCQKKLEKKMEEGSVQGHISDTLLFRHWNHYRDWQYSHLFMFNEISQKTEALTSGKKDFPASFGEQYQGFDISPDGATVCVAANFDKNPANSTNSDLFLISLNSDHLSPINITETNPAYDGSPVFSPDGQYLAYIQHIIPKYEADRQRLSLYDLKNKTSLILTDDIDNNIIQPKWSADSRYIYFLVEEKGHYPLHRLHLASKKIERLFSANHIREFAVSPDGQTIYLTRTSVGEPIEIFSYSLKNKKLTRCSFYNKEIEDAFDIRPAEEHWIKGAAGKDLHMFLVKPHNFDPQKKYPLIMNVHGGPQMMWSDGFRGDWQIYPAAGYIVAFPNPHGSTGYGHDYKLAISNDWNGKVIEDINKAAEYLKTLPYVNSDRMGAMGWSWGGYAMMWLAGHNHHFKALASMMGVYDLRSMYSATEELWFPEWDLGGTPWENEEFYRQASPSSNVKQFNTPCLVITGERDYRVPYTQSLQFFTDLQKMNVPSRLIVFSNDCHWPDNVRSMPVYYNAHLEWFQHYLQGGKAEYNTESLMRNRGYEPVWKDLKSKLNVDFRGISVISEDVVWVSGSHGTIARTINGGKDWQVNTIPNSANLEFRDIKAFDQHTAYTISAGSPARLYKTTDGGNTWTLQYENTHPKIFFNSMGFWDQNTGIAFSDPIDHQFVIIKTTDGGNTWTAIPSQQIPAAKPGEAGFAASGSTIATFGSNYAWIGTGGSAARILYTQDQGQTWQESTTPIISGQETCGIFSVAFYNESIGIAVGGDYSKPYQTTGNAAITRDGGKSWALISEFVPNGFRSVAAFVPNSQGQTILCSGPNGTDISYDQGQTWEHLSYEGFHTLGFSRYDYCGFAAGANGAIAELQKEALLAE